MINDIEHERLVQTSSITIEPISHGRFFIPVTYCPIEYEMWEWAVDQDICVIEHLFYDDEIDCIVIEPESDNKLTMEVFNLLQQDLLTKLY